MADTLLRLRVDNKEYDDKLKRATEGLNRYVDGCRKAGGTLEHLDDGVLDFVKGLGEMETVAQGGTQSLREMTKSITDLTIKYNSLTSEEKQSPFGQALSKSIDQLTERAGVVRDAMGDVQAAINHAASDTRVFDQISGTVSLATSTFQTFQGAAKLLGVELGDNVEVIAKLQAAMAVTNGLTQIQNALQKQSAVMQGVAALQAKANAAAQLLLAKNTAAATAAGEAFNVVARMNPYVLIASAVIAAGTALVAFTRHSKEATEAEKQQAEETERLRKKQEELQQAIGRHVGDVEAKYRSLQHEWSRLTTVAEKTDFVNQQAKAFQDLGLNVKTVTDAEQALVDKAPEVIAALKAVAQAEAYSDLYKQAIQKRATEWDNRIRGVETGDDYERMGYGQHNYKRIQDEWQAAGLAYGDYIAVTLDKMGGAIDTEYQLTKQGVDKINSYRAQQAAELNKRLEQQYNDEVQFYENKWTEAENMVIEARSKIPARILGGGSGDTTQIFPMGSLPQLTQQLKDLQAAQSQALNPRQWAQYQEQIQQTQYQIDAFKGKWQEGLQAIFTLNDSELLDKVRQVQDIIVDEKAMTVTVNTAEAYNQLRALTGNIENTTVQFHLQPDLQRDFQRGLSITTNAGMNAYINQIKQQIDQADLGSDLYNGLTSKLADATMLQNLVKESLSVGLGTALFDIADEAGQDFWDRIMSPEGVENADWQAIADAINQKRKELGLDAITIDVNTGAVSSSSKKKESNESELLDTSKNLVSGLAQVTNGLDQMGVKVSDGTKEFIQTAQGAMSVIEGVKTVAEIITGSTASSLVSTGITLVQALIANTTALFSNTAATTAASVTEGADMAMDVVKVGAMIMMAAHGGIVPRAASGYTVPGTHYSGDVTPVLANAGEVILNRAQQGNLVSQLQDGDGNSEGGYARPFVTGQDIFLGINNYLRGAGYGELITTKTLRQRGIM